ESPNLAGFFGGNGGSGVVRQASGERRGSATPATTADIRAFPNSQPRPLSPGPRAKRAAARGDACEVDGRQQVGQSSGAVGRYRALTIGVRKGPTQAPAWAVW